MKTNHKRGFVAKTHPNKAMQSWLAKLPSGAGTVSAEIGNDFHCGNRGMARNVRGAKKFIRSRVRLDRKRHIQGQIEDDERGLDECAEPCHTPDDDY